MMAVSRDLINVTLSNTTLLGNSTHTDTPMFSTDACIYTYVTLAMTLLTFPVILKANIKLPIKASLLNLSTINVLFLLCMLILCVFVHRTYRYVLICPSLLPACTIEEISQSS